MLTIPPDATPKVGSITEGEAAPSTARLSEPGTEINEAFTVAIDHATAGGQLAEVRMQISGGESEAKIGCDQQIDAGEKPARVPIKPGAVALRCGRHHLPPASTKIVPPPPARWINRSSRQGVG